MPTPFPQFRTVTNTGNQAITTTTETVIATLSNVNSRGANFPVVLAGSASFAVAAATTATILRIRLATVTGTIVGSQQTVSGGIAGDITAATGVLVAQYTPSGEMAGQTFVLTIQATGAGANWNVTASALTAQQ